MSTLGPQVPQWQLIPESYFREQEERTKRTEALAAKVRAELANLIFHAASAQMWPRICRSDPASAAKHLAAAQAAALELDPED